MNHLVCVGIILGQLACGSDTVPADAGDIRFVCSSDEQCDDSLFCNGQETCEPASSVANALGCVAGTPPCLAELCEEPNSRCNEACADADGDGFEDVQCGGTDCDDNDGNRFPGNPEVCDEFDHDEDCNVQTFGQRDMDRDRFFDIACCNEFGGMRVCGQDCADGVPGVNPVVPEVCNGYDDNCDGMTDDVCACTVPDETRTCGMNGPGTCQTGTETCQAGSWSACTGTLATSADYLCDGQDEDCDGMVDEGLTLNCVIDGDADGHRSPDDASMRVECPDPQQAGAPTFGCPDGYTVLIPSEPEDCCDTDPDSYPGAQLDWQAGPNECGSYDHDCDGTERPEIAETGQPSCESRFGVCRCNARCSPRWGLPPEVPECGATGRLYDGCSTEGPCGSVATPDVVQRCR